MSIINISVGGTLRASKRGISTSLLWFKSLTKKQQQDYLELHPRKNMSASTDLDFTDLDMRGDLDFTDRSPSQRRRHVSAGRSWFKSLSGKQRKHYLNMHPNSHFAISALSCAASIRVPNNHREMVKVWPNLFGLSQALADDFYATVGLRSQKVNEPSCADKKKAVLEMTLEILKHKLSRL